MRRILVAATALFLGFLVVPEPAGAAPTDLIVGGCGWEFAQPPGEPGTYVGIGYDASVTTDPTGVPTDATVSCWVVVNGVEAPGTRFSYSGLGVQSGVDHFTFAAGDTDWFDLCESVTFADGTTQLHGACFDQNFQLPPQVILDVLDIVNGDVDNAFVSVVDPAVCPALVRLAGTYGPVTIAPDGDVNVPDPLELFDGPVYDCPPYGNFS